MLPTLIQFGPVVISSLGVCIALGFILGSFVFWKRGKKEYFKEEELMDAAILTTLAGILGARIGWVVINFSQFRGYFWRIFDVIGYPGIWQFTGLLSAFAMLWYFSQKKSWDFYKIADIYIFGLSLFLIFYRIGLFLDGSYYGSKTNLPWGLRFPGLLEKRHPTQLYSLLVFLGFYQLLFWLEKNYRTLEWYQRKKGEANEGFLFATFLIFFGVLRFAVEFFLVNKIYWKWLSASQWASLVFVLAGAIVLFARSGLEFNIDINEYFKPVKGKQQLEKIEEKIQRKPKKLKKKRFKTGIDAKK